jgi:hypothetical protein
MPGELPPNFICSLVPIEVFLFYKMGKKQGNNKKSCLRKGEVLLRFGNALGRLIMPSGAPPTEEHTRMGTSTKILLNLKFYIIICQLPLCSLVLPAWLRGCPPPPTHPMAVPQVSGPSSTFLAGKGGQPSTISCDQILLVSSSSVLHYTRHTVRVFFWGR